MRASPPSARQWYGTRGRRALLRMRACTRDPTSAQGALRETGPHPLQLSCCRFFHIGMTSNRRSERRRKRRQEPAGQSAETPGLEACRWTASQGLLAPTRTAGQKQAGQARGDSSETNVDLAHRQHPLSRCGLVPDPLSRRDGVRFALRVWQRQPLLSSPPSLNQTAQHIRFVPLLRSCPVALVTI